MPNDCYNNVTIGASEDVINMLVENEFLFEKLRPLTAYDNESCIDFWSTKWERSDYKLIEKGITGLKINFTTAWNPPFKLFEYLIETHNAWIKCLWDEEGGESGVFVGKKGEESLIVSWEDWCLEEHFARMG
jgi:hypothetical protein